MLPTYTQPSMGDIVLDTDLTLMSLDTYEYFKDDYPEYISMVDLLGLFALAEAIVLNERLLSEHIIESDLSRSETIALLVKNEVIHRIPYIPSQEFNHNTQFYKAAWGVLEPLADQISDWSGADFTLEKSIERAKWCNDQNVDHLPWPVFGVLPSVVVNNTQRVITQAYRNMSDNLRSKVHTLQGIGAPIPMYIPPIPAVILERCEGKASKFFIETLRLRDEFAGTRKRLWKYQQVISGKDNLSLGEQFQAYQDSVADVVRELNRLQLKRTDSRLVLEIWDAVGELKVAEQSSYPELQSSLNLGALLSLGIKGFKVLQVKARARQLFDLYNKTLQIRNYGNLLEKVFHVESKKLVNDIDKIEKLGTAIDKLASVNRNRPWELTKSSQE